MHIMPAHVVSCYCSPRFIAVPCRSAWVLARVNRNEYEHLFNLLMGGNVRIVMEALWDNRQLCPAKTVGIKINSQDAEHE